MNNDVLKSWQNQPPESPRLPVEEIRRKAQRFQSQVARRNKREYVAAGIVVVVFVAYAYLLPGLLVKIGSVLLAAGAMAIAYQLHRKGSAQSVPIDATASTGVEFHRRELERQRDLLRSVWLWYLGPLVPGLAILSAGIATEVPGGLRPAIYEAALSAAVFIGVWLLNLRGAGKIQREIDRLKALSDE